MKILQVNKFFYRRGGAESHFFDLIKLLETHGQHVAVFSQKHPQNEPSPQAGAFITNIELDKFHWSALFRIGRMFWSFKAARLVKKIIAREKPDIVHIHNIYHQISPSILPAIKKCGLPIVMTVHDFKLIRPDYTLRTEETSARHKNSRLADAIIRLEFFFHRRLKIYQKYVDCFIAPSQFVKDRLAENGFDLAKIFVLPHFALTERIAAAAPIKAAYVLAFGRLNPEKGFDTLIRAWARISDQTAKLIIAGNGPDFHGLLKLIKELKLTDRISLTGQKNRAEIKTLIQNSRLVVVPSKVHETFGLSAMESQVLGKAVIASNAGALPEIIQDHKSGRIFPAGNVAALQAAIDDLWLKPDKLKLMERGAQLAAKRYDAEKYYIGISNLYQKLITCSKK